jgi:hypothetical protein
MNKDFISCEQALELKELGFDDDCLGYYNIDPNAAYMPFLCIYKPYKNEFCLHAPIYQQAFRWFREKKLCDCCVCRYQGKDDGGVDYYYVITKDFGIEETRHFKEGFFTYEEAELACLKKLIEIVKKY